MNHPLVRAQGLHRNYRVPGGGLTRAVIDVSLDVAQGARLAVVGESGSGKTTLLRLLLGIETPTGGTVEFDGTPVDARSRLRWLRRRTQYVPQDPSTSLNPRRTILDSVREPLQCLHVGGDSRARALECLDLVGLTSDHARRRPGELSGGQRQRVAIARALSIHPELIVADEAVSDLDAHVRLAVLDTLVDTCRSRGIALILVTHDLGCAARACDEVAVLDHGRLVDHGPLRQVFAQPAGLATRRLLDSVPRLPVTT